MHASPTSRAVALRWNLLLVMIAVSIITGLLTRSAFSFVLAIPFLVYAATGQALHMPKITVQMSGDRLRIAAGEIVTVHASVQCSTSTPVARMDWILPPTVEHVSGDIGFGGPVQAGVAVEFEIQLRCPRGEYVVRAPSVTVSNAALLREKTVQPPQRIRIRAVPAVFPPRQVAISPPAVNLFPGIIASRKAGTGAEFFDIREYRPGDSLRHVSRKSYTRGTGVRRLHVVEYEEERAVDVCIILDVRSHVYMSRGLDLFEASCTGAAALSSRFIADGNRVSLLQYGGALRWSPPGYGKRRRESILDELAGARPREHGAFRDLAQLPVHLLRAGTQLILVSPVHHEDIPELSALHARRFRIIVLRPDNLERSRQELPDDSERDLAYRLARLEHGHIAQELERAGILVVDWPAGQSLPACFAAERSRFAAWSRHL